MQLQVCLRRETDIEEGNMTTEAEIGVIRPQAKECQQPAEARRGENRILSWSLWREHSVSGTLISAQ